MTLIAQITPDEGRRIFEQQAQQRLGITGQEFIRRWDAGEYEAVDTPEVIGLAMLLPLGRHLLT